MCVLLSDFLVAWKSIANPCGDGTLCGVAVETNWVTKLRQETPLKRPKEKVAVLGH